MKIALCSADDRLSAHVLRALASRAPALFLETPVEPRLDPLTPAWTALFLDERPAWRRAHRFRALHLRRPRFVSPWSLYDRYVVDVHERGNRASRLWWRALWRVRYDVVFFLPVHAAELHDMSEEVLDTLRFFRAPYHALAGDAVAVAEQAACVLGVTLRPPLDSVPTTLLEETANVANAIMDG